MDHIKYTFLGLALGERIDRSALAVMDLVESVSSQRNPVTFAFIRNFQLRFRGVHRFPLDTPYTEIPELVREAVVQPPPGHFGTRPKSALAVDAAGPGVPVVELLRQARLECGILPATITGGGMGSLLPSGTYSVPRKELVTLVRIALENQMLIFPANMPLKNELTKELRTMDPAGEQSEHDDMVIAIALSLWAAAKRHPGVIQKKAA